MKKYVMAAGLAAVVAIAALASAGVGITGWTFSNGDAGSGHHGQNGEHHNKAMWHRAMERMKSRNKMVNAGRYAMRNLLNLDRVEGTLSYNDGEYYIGDTAIYFGDDWFMQHVIRSDYDGDGNYELVADELQGLIGKNVTINGIYENGTLIASHIDGMWLRMPVMAEFVEVTGELEKINGTYFIAGYKLIIPNRYARSDYDGDGVLERMRGELDGLVGENITIDGYIHNENLKPLHINGIAC